MGIKDTGGRYMATEMVAGGEEEGEGVEGGIRSGDVELYVTGGAAYKTPYLD